MNPALEAIVQFEEEEVNRYLSVDYPLEEVRKFFFPSITPEDYALLYRETRAGIREGTHVFLQGQRPPLGSLYLLSDDGLDEFCFDDSTQRAIKERLLQTKFKDEKYLDDYCDDVCKGYRDFVDHESFVKYSEVFEFSRKAQQG